MKADQPEQSSLLLPIFLSWEEAQNRARQYLIGEVFQRKQLQVKVEQVFVKGFDQKIWISLITSGSYKGEIRIGLEAYFDREAYAMHFPNPNLEMHTKNIFQKGVVLLLKGMLQSQLEKALDFDLREVLQQMVGAANVQLGSLEPLPGVEIKGKLNEVELLEFRHDNIGMHLKIASTGQLELVMGKAPDV